MIPAQIRLSERKGAAMTFSPDLEAFFRTEEQSRIQANIFDELAERGRFDEHGGYLSDEDWADSQ